MPSRYRDALVECCGGKLIVSLDFEGQCLTMHPLPYWQLVEEKLLSMPTLNPEARRLQRLIIGSSTEVEMDANGRIAILPILRAEVGIDKKIMLVGLGKKFEIWPEDVWKENYQGWVGAGPVDTEKLPESIQELVF